MNSGIEILPTIDTSNNRYFQQSILSTIDGSFNLGSVKFCSATNSKGTNKGSCLLTELLLLFLEILGFIIFFYLATAIRCSINYLSFFLIDRLNQ